MPSEESKLFSIDIRGTCICRKPKTPAQYSCTGTTALLHAAHEGNAQSGMIHHTASLSADPNVLNASADVMHFVNAKHSLGK